VAVSRQAAQGYLRRYPAVAGMDPEQAARYHQANAAPRVDPWAPGNSRAKPPAAAPLFEPSGTGGDTPPASAPSGGASASAGAISGGGGGGGVSGGGELAELGPVNRAKLRKVLSEVELLKRRIGQFDRRYAERDAIRAEVTAVVAQTRAVLLDSCRSMADQLEAQGLLAEGGEARDTAEALIRARIETVCETFASGVEGSVERNVAE
jgi:hypothetical protein